MDPILSLVFHFVLYSSPLFLIVPTVKSYRMVFFYAYFGFLFVFTQLFDILFTIQLTGVGQVTGGDIASASLLLLVLIAVILSRDIGIARNLI